MSSATGRSLAPPAAHGARDRRLPVDELCHRIRLEVTNLTDNHNEIGLLGRRSASRAMLELLSYIVKNVLDRSRVRRVDRVR